MDESCNSPDNLSTSWAVRLAVAIQPRLGVQVIAHRTGMRICVLCVHIVHGTAFAGLLAGRTSRAPHAHRLREGGEHPLGEIFEDAVVAEEARDGDAAHGVELPPLLRVSLQHLAIVFDAQLLHAPPDALQHLPAHSAVSAPPQPKLRKGPLQQRDAVHDAGNRSAFVRDASGRADDFEVGEQEVDAVFELFVVHHIYFV